MPEYYLIPGRGMVGFPDGTSREEAYSTMGVSPEAAAPRRAMPTVGTQSDIIDDFQRGFGQTVASIGSTFGGRNPSGWQKDWMDWGNEVVRNNPADYGSLRDVNGVGDFFGWGTERVMETLPALLGTAGAGLATVASGGSLGLAGLAAAGTGGALAFTDSAGGSLQAQREQGIWDPTRAYATALPAAALDTFTGGGGRVLRALGREAVTDILGDVAQKGFLREVRNTALSEAGTETAQTALQRLGGYEDLTSAEAMEHYLNAAAAGGFAGGVIGGGAYPFQNRGGDGPRDLLNRNGNQPGDAGGPAPLRLTYDNVARDADGNQLLIGGPQERAPVADPNLTIRLPDQSGPVGPGGAGPRLGLGGAALASGDLPNAQFGPANPGPAPRSLNPPAIAGGNSGVDVTLRSPNAAANDVGANVGNPLAPTTVPQKGLAFDAQSSLDADFGSVRNAVVGDQQGAIAIPAVRKFMTAATMAMRGADREAMESAIADLTEAHMASAYSGAKAQQFDTVYANARKLADDYMAAYGDEHVAGAAARRGDILTQTLASVEGKKPKEIEKLFGDRLVNAGMARRITPAEQAQIVAATKTPTSVLPKAGNTQLKAESGQTAQPADQSKAPVAPAISIQRDADAQAAAAPAAAPTPAPAAPRTTSATPAPAAKAAPEADTFERDESASKVEPQRARAGTKSELYRADVSPKEETGDGTPSRKFRIVRVSDGKVVHEETVTAKSVGKTSNAQRKAREILGKITRDEELKMRGQEEAKVEAAPEPEPDPDPTPPKPTKAPKKETVGDKIKERVKETGKAAKPKNEPKQEAKPEPKQEARPDIDPTYAAYKRGEIKYGEMSKEGQAQFQAAFDEENYQALLKDEPNLTREEYEARKKGGMALVRQMLKGGTIEDGVKAAQEAVAPKQDDTSFSDPKKMDTLIERARNAAKEGLIPQRTVEIMEGKLKDGSLSLDVAETRLDAMIDKATEGLMTDQTPEQRPTVRRKPPAPQPKPQVETVGETTTDRATQAESYRERVFDLVNDDNKKGLVAFARKLHKSGVLDDNQIAEVEMMASDRDMGVDDIGPEVEGGIDQWEQGGNLSEQQMNRRDFLKGVAATAAAAVSAKALPAGAQTPVSQTAVEAALANDVDGALRAIAQNSKDPIRAAIARKLLQNGMGRVTIGAKMGMPETLWGETRLNDDGSSTIDLNDPNGFNEETILHELIHAYVQQRWGGLNVYLPSNKEMLGDTTDRGDATVKAFQDLWRKITNALEKTQPDLAENVEWAAALGSPSELLSWTLTNKDVQAFMRSVDENGNKVDPNGSLWEQFKAWIMGVLGMPYTPQVATALDSILAAGNAVIDAGADVRTGDFNTKIAQELARQRGESQVVERQEVRENINRQPQQLRKSSNAVTDFIGGKPGRTLAYMALGPKLIEMAQRAGLKAAGRYYRLMNEREGLVKRAEERHLKLLERFDRLPAALRGRGKGTLNGLGKDMVMSGKWAFKPSWLRDANGKPIDVTVDPEMQRQYRELGDEGMKVLEDAFKLAHEMYHEKSKAILDLIASDFDAEIKEAQTKLAAAENAKDDAQVKTLNSRIAKLEKNKALKLSQFRGHFNANISEPYLPTRRFGKFVVVGRSTAYLAEEKRAKQTNDYTRLTAMKQDPAHYYVDFAETEMQAARMKRELDGMYADTDKFTRDEASQLLVTGADMLFSFQKLRALINDQIKGAEQKAELNRMINDLQLATLAQTSSRKAEMTRLKVNGGDFDMFRGLAQQGRADGQYIASLYRNDAILDSLNEMRREVTHPDGQNRQSEGREERQSLSNEIIARHAMSMAPAPSPALVDMATSLTSAHMLASSPAFMIQQAFQNAVITMPVLAAKFGYDPTIDALGTGYKMVTKAWKNTRWHESLRIDQLPQKYQALATLMAERGLLDVGINAEIGGWTSDSQNLATRAMQGVLHRLNGYTRKMEAINRLSAGIATFELEMASKDTTRLYDRGAYLDYVRDFNRAHKDSGMTKMTEREFAAFYHAAKIINDTHGAYSVMDAPRFMRGPVGRVLFQFKKFQIMLVQLYAQGLRDAFNSNISAAERKIARRTVAYMAGHAFVIGGALGLPGMTLFQLLYDAMTDDEEERGDLQRDMREAIGDPEMANLLLNGVPTLAGLNLTGSMGQGNILSIAPYADVPSDKKELGQFALELMGPAIGGLLPNMFEGYQLMSEGETYRGFEKMAPRGVASIMRAMREAGEGETNTRGEVTQEEIRASETFATFLGLNSVDRTSRQFNRDQEFENEAFFEDRSAKLRKMYIEARDEGDAETLAAVRNEWYELQQARQAAGYRRQPFSLLLRGYRERNRRERDTVGGVQFNRGNRRAVENTAEMTGTDEYAY